MLIFNGLPIFNKILTVFFLNWLKVMLHETIRNDDF